MKYNRKGYLYQLQTKLKKANKEHQLTTTLLTKQRQVGDLQEVKDAQNTTT